MRRRAPRRRPTSSSGITGRLYDPKTNVATGLENSADPINALQVLKDHTSGLGNVSSITLGPTEEQMSRGQASMLLRESSFIGYFRDHAPKLNFAISYVPPAKQDGCGLTGTGWALLVNKKSQIEQPYSKYLDQITQGQTQPKAAADALAPRIDQLLKQS